MPSHRIHFNNSRGHKLAARLEIPGNGPTRAWAVFAHCFTCNKNLKAVHNICQAMNSEGIAVLRFDFTGLGESEGDFVETDFSSNVADIEAACEFMEKEHGPVSLLIGHSLGGAAVLFAAARISSVKAVATIGAPASPEHVQHLFANGIEEMQEKGQAQVSIGGRPFTISHDFLKDIRSKDAETLLAELRKPLLVMHSPQDSTVGIANAERIYKAARHPKSYVSLDGADHLLSQRADSVYAGKVIAAWAQRYLGIEEPVPLTSQHTATVRLRGKGFTSDVVAQGHAMLADEPVESGGNAFGPSPFGFLAAGLGACTAMTINMYVGRKDWPMEGVTVHVDHAKVDDEQAERGKTDLFTRTVELKGQLTDDQRKRILDIADKCPVHRTLTSISRIETNLASE